MNRHYVVNMRFLVIIPTAAGEFEAIVKERYPSLEGTLKSIINEKGGSCDFYLQLDEYPTPEPIMYLRAMHALTAATKEEEGVETVMNEEAKQMIAEAKESIHADRESRKLIN